MLCRLYVIYIFSYIPSELDALSQCLIYVGPTTATLAHHETSIDSLYCVLCLSISPLYTNLSTYYHLLWLVIIDEWNVSILLQFIVIYQLSSARKYHMSENFHPRLINGCKRCTDVISYVLQTLQCKVKQ